MAEGAGIQSAACGTWPSNDSESLKSVGEIALMTLPENQQDLSTYGGGESHRESTSSRVVEPAPRWSS
jgi:hypothetical protein